MVLNLCQAPDDPNQQRIVRDAQLVAKFCATRRMIGEKAKVRSQGNYFDLPPPPNSKLLTNLDALLLADDNQTIRRQPRQQAPNSQEDSGAPAPVIAVKNVAVISMHKLALARLSNQRARRQPAIQEAGGASDSSRFRRVRMHNVRALAQKHVEQFPNSDSVLPGYLAAHLAHVNRKHTLVRGEIAHVFFTFGNLARNQQGDETRLLQT